MRLIGAVAAAVFLLDQASKWLVVVGMDLMNRGTIEVWPPFLTFRMAWNRGVNFGLMAGDGELTRWLLAAVALAICAAVLWWMRGPQGWPVRVAAGLLIGGALGNVVDRLVWGAVADFLNISCCGIDNPFAFNVADISIFLGAVGLALLAGSGTPAGRKTP